MTWLRRVRESTTWRPARRLVEALRTLGYRLLGMATCLTVSLVSGGGRRGAPQRVSTPQHIILLRPDRVGDVILSLPAFQAVREAFPSATVTAVVTRMTAPLLRHHPAVDRCVTVVGDGLWELRRSGEAIQGLRALKPDVAIAFEASWACGLLAYLTGAPERVGWDFRGARGFFTRPVPFRSAVIKTHEIDANLQLVQALGIPAVRRLPELRLSQDAREWASQRWRAAQWPTDGVRVMIHPGSRSAYTRWAPERFAAIADRLIEERGAHVWLLEGPGEAALVKRVQSLMTRQAHRLSDLTLEQLAALLEQMDLFIGNATGTIHLAAYLGPCVIEIIGGTHPLDCPERWGVIGARHRIVHKRPEEVVGRPTTSWVGPEGLAHIGADDVWRAVQEVWPFCLEGRARRTPRE